MKFNGNTVYGDLCIGRIPMEIVVDLNNRNEHNESDIYDNLLKTLLAHDKSSGGKLMVAV